MKTNFPDNMTSNVGEQLKKGEIVTVVGAAQRRGHLLVDKNGNFLFFQNSHINQSIIIFRRCN